MIVNDGELPDETIARIASAENRYGMVLAAGSSLVIAGSALLAVWLGLIVAGCGLVIYAILGKRRLDREVMRAKSKRKA